MQQQDEDLDEIGGALGRLHGMAALLSMVSLLWSSVLAACHQTNQGKKRQNETTNKQKHGIKKQENTIF
jgi:hypothetical protein